MFRNRQHIMRAVAVAVFLFGLMTLKEGGSVLFFDGEARRAAGDYVPFVLQFNFLTGFFYIAAAVALWRDLKWGFALSATFWAASFVIFGFFASHIAGGGAYEERTVKAMFLRSGVLTVTLLATYWQLKQRRERSRDRFLSNRPEPRI